MKLLLLEDDDLLAESLAESLKDNGYLVDLAASLKAAKSLMATEDYELAILDVGLPDGSGLDLLAHWRKQKRSTPILILTARDTWEDKVIGLETGADDYLTKPFHEAELMARLKALLRRQSGQLSHVITLNGVSLDEAGQRVCLEGETWRSLTATEFRLLRYLMLHPDRIHSKDQLLEQLYALDQDAAAPNLVEVYIARLRRYLGKSVIQTRRGQGYFFASH
ncbi:MULTISPECIES: response regulator transcription factor [Halomonadaceae]|jgi:DNA-binding response OmpR family regulator|uniref:Response regulator transcription factor n=4 Tax=Halomonadaceae TaxID=28256 RepID=A0A7Z0NBV3_9GAMM|nr:MULTISPECIES: response regulator transcription factor [Halomonas]MBR9904254.1 response regulator transcription factor [Gammaproteobacteria bacterium]NGO90620.1 response regulator [Halomonas sp.]TDV99872.1 DNA-binding response OmpR family regulator [Halomonas alkaliantarctica]ATH77140.1 DNA-binding response regulator [Halomonas hydrothermalis]ELY20517.1 Signal transduction response regulator, receiver domain [Halomonas titanicae BH1]|tara:strand:+ start:428 stop:1093 length:666 start_codon:yes stop_codon:yes gene_type:complete